MKFIKINGCRIGKRAFVKTPKLIPTEDIICVICETGLCEIRVKTYEFGRKETNFVLCDEHFKNLQEQLADNADFFTLKGEKGNHPVARYLVNRNYVIDVRESKNCSVVELKEGFYYKKLETQILFCENSVDEIYKKLNK